MYQESVRMLSRVAFWGVINNSSPVGHQHMVYPPSLQLPTNKWRSTGPGRSWCLFSITGSAALDGQYHSLSGTYFSASNRVTCLLPATQAESHAGSKVYIWNVFGWEYINRSQKYECRKWDCGSAVPCLGIFVSNLWYCVFALRPIYK